MPYVQTCARWIREHVQNIIFRARYICLHTVYAVFPPFFLPFRLYLAKIIFHCFRFTESFRLIYKDKLFPLIAQCAPAKNKARKFTYFDYQPFLFLRSSFTIFAEYRMQLGIVKRTSSMLCTRLSLYLQKEKNGRDRR